MPKRRRRAPAAAADLIDDVVDSAVDTLFDRASDAFSRFRETQQQSLTDAQRQATYKCAGCHRVFSIDKMEMLHPTNGFGTCKRCFAFMWKAAKEKIAALGRQTARQPAAEPSPPPGKPPWEILGVSQNASVEEIKSAYRRLAMMWHPDRVPPGASSEQRLQAQEMFQEITRCRDVMLNVRKPPEA